MKATIRAALSPRHAPDAVIAVPAIPRTMTGKKLELPVKKILTGSSVEEVASRDALVDPDAIEAFAEYAQRAGRADDAPPSRPRARAHGRRRGDGRVLSATRSACEPGLRPPLPFPGAWLYVDGQACLHVADRAAYEAHAADRRARAHRGRSTTSPSPPRATTRSRRGLPRRASTA